MGKEHKLLMKEINQRNLIARLENEFLFNAFFNLNGNDYDAIMFCIGLLEPDSQEDFYRMSVSARDFFDALGIDYKKNKASYGHLRDMSKRMASHIIEFPRGYQMEDKKTGERYDVAGAISWFQYFIVTKNMSGETHIHFCFSEILKHSLLNLKKYVALGYQEIKGLEGGAVKHQYTLLKTYRNKTKMHNPNISIYKIEWMEWRQLLGLENKYNSFKTFSYHVLKYACEKINRYERSKISYSYNFIREGRKVKYIEFKIWDKKIIDITPREDFVPTKEDIYNLTFARKKGYDELVKLGVKEGIAFKRLIPSIKGEMFIGYEDYFIKAAIVHFKKTAKNKSAGVFVDWWHKHKVFDVESGVWSSILEDLNFQKRKLEEESNEVLINREKAKGMTYKDFTKWYKSKQNN